MPRRGAGPVPDRADRAARAARSGTAHRLAGHGYEAQIASIGASLRTLRAGGRDLVVPFEENEVRPAYRGATLAPWPNRIVDGWYVFGGEEHQLPLTEPARGHALHGLVCWADFVARVVEPDRVVLATTIVPQAGYPFRVEVETEYRIGANGLTQTVTGRNLGTEAAPWGTGPHPYLLAGAGRVDDWSLSLPADTVLTVTADRLSPIVPEPVDAHPAWDFRSPRPIGDVFIDHAFTGLRDQDGSAEVVVRARGGEGVAITWDRTCPWVQVHTADTPQDATTHRIGLAVEPMTCAPDAFNSGAGLLVLAPGAEHSVSWRIHAV